MTDRLLATYRVAAPHESARARAEALAAEQSVEMPVSAIRDERVLAEIVARVEAIRPVEGGFEADIALASTTTGMEASQLRPSSRSISRRRRSRTYSLGVS